MSKYTGKRPNALKIDLKSTQGLYMTTVNPCNQFLVDFLISSKLKSEKQGIGKFTTYNLAIQSVRKYPLPIICQAQLAALQGFGDFFINEAAKRIQKHYLRGRLPTHQQILEDDNQHFQALQANRRKGYKRRKHQNQVSEFDQDQKNSQQQQEDKKTSNIQTPQQKNMSSNPTSKEVKKVQNYKPRANSESWKILQALFILNARYKPVSKGQINQIFFDESKYIMKSWEISRNRLKQSGYIEFDELQGDLTKLTKKGYQFICQQLKENNSHKSLKPLQKQSQKPMGEKQKTLKITQCKNWQQLTILINQNADYSEEQKEMMDEVFKQIGEHNVVYDKLEIGHFLWQIQSQILDFIVIILYIDLQKWDQQRFITHFQQAKLCNNNFIILLQIQSPTDNYNQEKIKQINKVISKFRVFGFKIILISNFEEAIAYVSQVTKMLKKKLSQLKQNQDYIRILGSIQSFNKKIIYKKSLGKHFSRCMTLLTKMNKKAAENLARKFGTFKKAEQKMRQNFSTQQLKLKFLKILFKDCNIERKDLQNIVTFFYSQNYEC